jgi:hypothetical protein
VAVLDVIGQFVPGDFFRVSAETENVDAQKKQGDQTVDPIGSEFGTAARAVVIG